MISRNAHETRRIAARLAKTLKGGDVLGLIGPLGAGKTTFVQGLAKALGIKKKVTSSTFVLLQSYKLNKPYNHITIFTHVDCYRLNDPQQLIDIGIHDHFTNPHTLTVIEWADKCKYILPNTTKWITFTYGVGRKNSRKFTFTHTEV